MQIFNYKAKNIQGKIFSGQLKAENKETAAIQLKQKGYFLLDLYKQSRFAGALDTNNGFGGRVSTKDKAIFTHQLSTLLRAGMKLTKALKTLEKQTQNKHLTTIINQIHLDIEQSSSLSESMAKHPKVFNKVYTAIIASAEQSGSLSQTLAILSQQLKTQASVNSRIKSALIYPFFLLFVCAIVIAVLMTFVVPKFIELFINAEQAIPLPTKILVTITNVFKQYWPMVICITAGVICVLMTALKNERVKIVFDTMLLKIPLWGKINIKLQLAKFTRTLGSLLNGGVRILNAINTTKGTTNNTAISREIHQITEHILKGSTLATAMGNQKYFSELTVNMVAVGEDTGTLPEMLLEVAEMYDQESESAINAFTTLLGPLMILVLGFIIGFVVLAILMPIFETSSMVN